jgi:glycosyltransferase involved in cell wall biosynthesis
VKACSKVMIIGVEPRSLISFRGQLMSAMKTSNHSVVSVSSPLSESLAKDFNEAKLSHKPVCFQRTGLNPIADVKTFLQLYCTYREERPDLILAYTIKPVIWGGLAARFAGVKFHALVTGLGFAFQGQGLKRKLLTKLVSFLYKVALSHATKVIFQNEDNRQLFVSRRIVPIEKTEVVNGSGVDIARFSYSPIDPIDIVQPIRFLCVARLLGEKGLREYAKAAEAVKRIYPQVEVVLVGPEDTSPDGIPIDEIQTWASSQAIDYRGSAIDVRPFIQRSHVYVLPSYHEGLPRSTIEAMSIGRPVITTTAVGCRETVEEGVNGFKVAVADAKSLAEKMIWFIEHPEQIEPMGLASRRMAEDRFDVHKVNAKMLEIMELS